ncbi:hypothetical protein LTS10_006193 [Elasticomyces elasticus]|nr:hypothetical protein LTS10_006193 [Elasticomyces elasticus]
MKFATTIVALATVAVQAAAVLDHASHETHPIFKGGVGHCGAPGGECQQGKHLARGVADAIRSRPNEHADKNVGFSAFCSVPGSSGCNNKWTNVEKIGHAAEKAHAAISAREAEADAEAVADANPKNNWIGYCGVRGSFCAAKREALAEAGAEPKNNWIGYCGVRGSFCAKREAVEKRDAEAKKNWIGYCGVRGSFCAKARDLEASPDQYRGEDYIGVPGASVETKRSAEADPKKNWIGYCGVRGSFCAMKRDAEAEAQVKREADADAEAGKNSWIGYCGVRGSFCARDAAPEADAKKGKKLPGGQVNYCGVPGSFCARDAKVEEVQNAIRKFNPNIEKAECYQHGQPCDLITKAHKAFKQIQAREAEAKNNWIGYCGVRGSFCAKRDADKLAHCSCEGCSTPAKAHLQASVAGHEAARKAEDECHAPHGACTLAARAIDELEEAINEGLSEVYDL